MNRRKFIVESTIGATALTLTPSTALGSNLSTTGTVKNFTLLAESNGSFSSSMLYGHLSSTLNRLIETLSKDGYRYDINDMFKMGDRCYGLPVRYPSFLGSDSNQLALIVDQDAISSKFIVMNQKLTEQLNELAMNFKWSMSDKEDVIDAGAFVIPYRLESFETGRYQKLVFTNKFKTTIILSNDKKSAFSRIM